VRDTVLIYDAGRGTQEHLICVPCECLIFSSPGAGNFNHAAESNGLVRFICPSCTLEELQLLDHGYGGRWSSEVVESLFERFGGSPRAVVVHATSISESNQEREARDLLRGVQLW